MHEQLPTTNGVGSMGQLPTAPVVSDFKKGLKIVEKFIDFINYSGVDNLDEKKLTYENIMKAIDLFK